jgi:lactoylglutathione lyase
VTSPTLRLELFTDDVPAAVDFYVRVLGFTREPERAGGYTPLSLGSVRIAVNLRSELDEGHPLRLAAGERPGRGVEIVLEVDDVQAVYRGVVFERWPRAAELRRQPWGLTDFRVLDPDGYYWRVTSRA